MSKVKIYTSIFLLFNFICSGILLPFNNIKADSNKVITITFATTPISPVVSKTKLKYNKDFALSYSFDDGLIRGYDTAFKYMNGGYSDYLGQYFGGLYFTDGAGNNVPFRGGYAFYTRNSSYSDIHINTPSYIKWTQLQEAVDSGWNVFNHGYISASVPAENPNYVYYIGDPGGHATGSLDYAYELTQANIDVASHINLKNNAGTVTGPLNVSQVILPNGDGKYIQPAFDNGFNAVYAQNGIFPFDGSTTTAPTFTNISDPISNNRHVMPRWFDYEYKYLPAGEYPGGLFNHVDQVASLSTGSIKYWTQEFTHQITASTYYPDWNGGITWDSWKSLMDHIENTYGRFGNDKAWVAGAEEVYNYMMVKQNSIITQNLVGNVLTIEIDTTNVPANLKNYALSLLISSDNNAVINNINYGIDFTHHTDNKTTGLINIDWGVNSYSKNDITRVESLVSSAETSKKKSDIDVARSYVNLLTTNPSSIKTSYVSRLDAIVVPLRTWYINVKGITSLVNCNDANGATTTKSYSPSIYNWNLFTVGNTSATACGDLSNIRDSDNQISNISLSNTAPFKNGGLPTADTGNNSAIYPDAVIGSAGQIYSSVTTPAKVKISGLESIKTYNIKLYGYTSATGATGNSAITLYTISSTTKELIVKSNTTSTVEFLNVIPIAGEIEVTVAPKVAAWGYGFLNAFEIKENILAAPTNLSYSSPNTYTKNSDIAPLSPTVTGLGITYSVSPTLPSGLSISTSTGIISGTPTSATSLATYTVSATNNGGSTTFGVVMGINNIAPSSLSYNSPNNFTRNTSITPLTPTINGEEITYSISPTLPSGLSLDASTGIISGTPTATSTQTSYTVTATNSGGSTTFNVVITINNIAPTNLSYTSPNNYIKDSAITPLSPTITGADLNYSISPSLPVGILISTSTGIISGTPNATSTQTTYTVTATNSGGSTTFDLVISVVINAPSSLSYNSPNNFIRNTSITPISPTVTGEGITYSVSPVLPSGLSLDDSTGIISGTPTATSSSITYTIAATNDGGYTTFDVVIAVGDVISYTLSYLAGANGVVAGTIYQSVVSGSDGTQVTATPNTNYHFIKWSDNVLEASRKEINVIANLSVTALFAADILENNSSAPVSLPAAIGSGSSDESIPMNESRGIGALTNSGTNILAYINSQANFQAPESSNNNQLASHSLNISNLDLATNIITITISSKPQIIILQKGENKLIDIDGDNINDIEVTFANVYVNRAEVTVKALNGASPVITSDSVSNTELVTKEELILSAKVNAALIKRLAGQILLQVETKGQAWYLDKVSLERYYLADGPSAYQALHKFGLGITNNDLNKIPVAPTSVLPSDYTKSTNYSTALTNRLSGRIVLQVENHGEAWYINQVDGYRYYLANGDAAYQIMKNLSLGISNINIRQITVGSW
jgi:hypothetical protein